MEIQSLDPRVNRLKLKEGEPDFEIGHERDQWATWEVFHQQARGDQHKHVGIVHAPTAEIAMLFAKEQYARRMKCVNLWVVRTADVVTSSYEDADMFDPAFDKSYRESFGYAQTRAKIDAYKKELGIETRTHTTVAEKTTSTQAPKPKTARRAGIVIGKRKS